MHGLAIAAACVFTCNVDLVATESRDLDLTQQPPTPIIIITKSNNNNIMLDLRPYNNIIQTIRNYT